MLNICHVQGANSIKLEAVDLQFAIEQSNWQQAQSSTEQQQDGISQWEIKKQLKTSSEETEVSLRDRILLLNNGKI